MFKQPRCSPPFRQLPPTKCDPTTIRLSTEDLVSNGAAHTLVIELAKVAKVAEHRISTMGGAVDKNYTVRVAGTPVAAAEAVQDILKQCRDEPCTQIAFKPLFKDLQ